MDSRELLGVGREVLILLSTSPRGALLMADVVSKLDGGSRRLCMEFFTQMTPTAESPLRRGYDRHISTGEESVETYHSR